MFFQINCGIPLELGRLVGMENGGNLTQAEQQKLSPPTPFADTMQGTNCCFSEEQTGQLEEEGEEIGDAPGMLFQSKRIPDTPLLPNLTDHFSPAPTSSNEPGETNPASIHKRDTAHLTLCFLRFRI